MKWNMTVDRMTAPPSSTQQKLHLQPLLPTLKVCYSQSKPKMTVLEFPVGEKTNCFNFLVIILPYTCMWTFPDLTPREAILFVKEMCFQTALHEPESWGIFPHHVIIHTLDSCEATENIFLPNYVDVAHCGVPIKQAWAEEGMKGQSGRHNRTPEANVHNFKRDIFVWWLQSKNNCRSLRKIKLNPRQVNWSSPNYVQVVMSSNVNR